MGGGRIELTESDLIAALLEARGEPGNADGALTMREIVQQTQWGERRLQLKLEEMKRAGRIEVVRVEREALDGRLVRVPGYRLRGEKCGDS